MTTKKRKPPKCAICGKSRSPVPNGIPVGKRRTCWRSQTMDWCGNEKMSTGFHLFMAFPRED